MKAATLENELATVLFRISYGKLSFDEAKTISSRLVKNIDLNDNMIAHKGVNWYAKEILKNMPIEKYITTNAIENEENLYKQAQYLQMRSDRAQNFDLKSFVSKIPDMPPASEDI